MNNKLYRSNSDKMLGGVCGGLGEHYKIDPTLIRLAFVLLFLFGGHGLLVYLILCVIMPPAPDFSSKVVDVEPRQDAPVG